MVPDVSCIILLVSLIVGINSVVDQDSRPDKNKQRIELKPLDIHGYDSATSPRPPPVIFEGRARQSPGEGRRGANPPGEGRRGANPPASIIISEGYSRVSGTVGEKDNVGPRNGTSDQSDRARSISDNLHIYEKEQPDTISTFNASLWGSDRTHLPATTKSYFWNSWLLGRTDAPNSGRELNSKTNGNRVPQTTTDSYIGSGSNIINTILVPPSRENKNDSPRSGGGNNPRQDSTQLTCPEPNGLFPHPYNCAKYLQCAHNRLFIRDCGPGTVFNPVHSVCDWPYNVNCQISFPENGVPQGGELGSSEPEGRSPGHHGKTVVDGLFDRASDLASRAVEKIETTATGVLDSVNNVIKEVDWGITRGVDKSKRILKKIGVDVDTICPQENGQFPYFKDCRMYLNCWRNRPHLQTCPTNLLFNGATGTCDWPSRVVCPKARVVIQSDSNTPNVLKAPPSGQKVRLRGGDVPWAGYVQVWDSGVSKTPGWGLVVDQPDGWTERDGDVVCKSLGYKRGAASVSQGRMFGLLPGERVALSSPSCLGSEDSIGDCVVEGKEQGSEENKEEALGSSVAGVRCIPNHPSLCDLGGVLWGGKCYYLATSSPPLSLNTMVNGELLTMSHSEAKSHCNALGRRLLTVKSQEENHFVSELLGSLPSEVGGFHTAAVRTSLLGEVLWLWQGTDDPPRRSLEPFTKWWTGWNSTGSSDEDTPYSTPGLQEDISSTLCVVMRELFPHSPSSPSTKVHADYHWWELTKCEESLSVICEAPPRDIGCIVGRGSSYRGNASITSSGSKCSSPPSNSPLYPSPKYYQSLVQPNTRHDESGLSLASISLSGLKDTSFYCRNLDSEDLPWCYIETGITEYCDIPRCKDQSENLATEVESVCPSGKLLCPSSRECIYSEWFCDGREDCLNGDDEVGCPDYTGNFSVPVQNSRLTNGEMEKWLYTPFSTCASRCAMSKSFVCKSFNYQENSSTCVLCDAVAGRFGGLVEDEGWNYHERKQFSIPPEQCQNKCEDGRCYSDEQMCDGRRDCRSGVDEVNCFSSVEFALRLVNGSVAHEGRVEIRVLGRWGGVCDDLWDIHDGDVVCRQLGYNLGAREVYVGGRFGGVEATGDDKVQMFLMDDVNCGGNEERLQDCTFGGWGEHDCNQGETASVRCALEGDSCDDKFTCENGRCIDHIYLCDGMDDCYDQSDEKEQYCKEEVEIRLAGSRGDSTPIQRSKDGAPREGRVEVMFRGVWGTICDDDFGLEEGHVVCRALKLGGAAAIFKNNTFGPGSGKIWLDDMRCLGHEESLEQCSHRGWGHSNCDHSEDVGVRCEENLLDEVDLESSSFNDSPDSPSVLPNACGERYVEDTPITLTNAARVVGGKHTRAGAHPWMVGIRLRTSTGSTHWCGGAIISTDLILTAAHCMSYPTTTYIIRVGDYDNQIEEEFEQEFFAERVLKHPEFDKGPFYNNDIAILKIKRKNREGITFNEHTQPLCLTHGSFHYPSGLNCTVAGWGATAHNSGFSQTLRSTSLPLIPDSVCRSDRVFGGSKLSSGMFCAGYLEGGVDTCQGDSGGPLVCYINGRHAAVGITSWGHGCARPNKPGVYTRLTHYLAWMNTILERAEDS